MVDKVKIRTTNQEFKIIERLGTGTYGTVDRAVSTNTKEEVAIKRIKLESQNEGIPATTLREIAILSSLDHPNLVKLIHIELSETNIYLMLEYVKYDLKKYWDSLYKGKKTLPDLSKIKYIMHQILLGVDFLHGRKILHRDLKPQNILITPDEDVKIADFGLSRTYSIPIRKYTKEVLTLWYRSHELILGMDYYSTGIDMWSIGCIFGELLINEPLIRGDSEFGQMQKTHELLGSPTEDTLPGFKSFFNFDDKLPFYSKGKLEEVIAKKSNADENALDLLKKLLLYNPHKRISCRDALIHPFFDELKK